MANLEFPKNTNTTSSKENVESINKTSKANTDRIIKAIQVAMVANAQATADEWYKKDRAKGIAKADAEQKIDNIGNNIKKAMSPITNGLKEIGSKVADSVKSATDSVYTEVFGSGLIAESIKNVLGKTLKKISDSLTFIGEWLFKKGGNLLKKILVGTLVFFGWLKKFLMKSMLFKAIGGIAKMAWKGIESTISLGGDLIGAIASKLVGSAAVSALVSGIKSLTAGLTATAFMGVLAKALLAAGFGAALGAGIAQRKFEWDAGMAAADIFKGEGDNVDRATVEAYLKENRKNMTPKEIELYEKALSKYDTESKNNLVGFENLRKQLAANGWDIDKDTTEELYNGFLKLFPQAGKNAGLEKGLFNSDKNKDGFKDFDNDRYHKLLPEIYKITQNGLPQSAIEALKNKSVLKNAAGVSST